MSPAHRQLDRQQPGAMSLLPLVSRFTVPGTELISLGYNINCRPPSRFNASPLVWDAHAMASLATIVSVTNMLYWMPRPLKSTYVITPIGLAYAISSPCTCASCLRRSRRHLYHTMRQSGPHSHRLPCRQRFVLFATAHVTTRRLLAPAVTLLLRRWWAYAARAAVISSIFARWFTSIHAATIPYLAWSTPPRDMKPYHWESLPRSASTQHATTTHHQLFVTPPPPFTMPRKSARHWKVGEGCRWRSLEYQASCCHIVSPRLTSPMLTTSRGVTTAAWCYELNALYHLRLLVNGTLNNAYVIVIVACLGLIGIATRPPPSLPLLAVGQRRYFSSVCDAATPCWWMFVVDDVESAGVVIMTKTALSTMTSLLSRHTIQSAKDRYEFYVITAHASSATLLPTETWLDDEFIRLFSTRCVALG